MPASPPQIAVVVLAGGTSTRMSQPKQLLRWKGKILVQHVVDAAAESTADEVIVVLGRVSGDVESALNRAANTRVVHNPEFESGQASSLHAGLTACSPGCEAAVVVLGDQPQLRRDLIDLVIARWRGTGRPVVRCVFRGAPGHPVLLAREVWELLPAEGDQGARSLIAEHPELVEDVALDEPALLDVDTPGDFGVLGNL